MDTKDITPIADKIYKALFALSGIALAGWLGMYRLTSRYVDRNKYTDSVCVYEDPVPFGLKESSYCIKNLHPHDDEPIEEVLTYKSWPNEIEIINKIGPTEDFSQKENFSHDRLPENIIIRNLMTGKTTVFELNKENYEKFSKYIDKLVEKRREEIEILNELGL